MCFSFWGTSYPLLGLCPSTQLGDFRPPDLISSAVLKFPKKIPWWQIYYKLNYVVAK